MARERSPLRKRALKLWLDSNRTLKPAAIAAALGISNAMVRKWKSIDKWEQILEGPRRPGAPKGNKNAKGNKGGAPKRNSNALKSGEYATIWEDSLEDVERMLLFEVDTDPIGQINNELRLLEIRERRMLQLRNRILEGWDASEEISKSQLVDEDSTEVAVIDEFGSVTRMNITQPSFKEVERIKKTPQVLERILSIEEAITRIQDKKAKLIDLKYKINMRELTEEETRLRIRKTQLEIKNMEGMAW